MTTTADTLRAQFAELLERHRGIALKVARSYCHDVEDRKDLLQEISTQAWQAFAGFDGQRAQFSTWLYRVALNVAISRVRAVQVRQRHHADNADIDAFASTVDSAEDNAQLAQLQALIRSLPALDRALLLLHLDDCSHREIGDVLGISPGNAATRLHRLKLQLRQQFAEAPSPRSTPRG